MIQGPASVPSGLVVAERLSRRAGHVVIKTGADLLWVEAHGYVGPSLLRADLAFAARFGAAHAAGWSYIVDVSSVRFANPLNVFWLRRIPRLPNLRRYVVIARSPLVRFILRLVRWLVRVDDVVADAAAALALLG